ncbi:MAG TPA: phage tail sheath C-terminal domain-containing protein [bacterium]|nr:phage tail sheath C-terminal domain-containing protein [bacterium]
MAQIQSKTPGVHVEEISVFPPSVAQVATAIPAFVGYTAKAQEMEPDDLLYEPTRITSLLEYRQYFGGAPPLQVNSVDLDENNAVLKTSVASGFYMYDSLRIFFQNGGGECYIVPIGVKGQGYDVAPSQQHFKDGLKALRKKDEPTLIVFPDAVLLGEQLYNVQVDALTQCGDLMDRFSVFDLLESKQSDATFGWEEGYKEFRNRIGMSNLEFGAAYTPWLKSSLSKEIHYRDVRGNIRKYGKTVTLSDLTDDATVQTLITDLQNIIDDRKNVLSGDLETNSAPESTIKRHYESLVTTFKNRDSSTATQRFKALFNYIYDIAKMVDDWTSKVTHSDLQSFIDGLIDSTLRDTLAELIAWDKGANDDSDIGTASYDLYTAYTMSSSNWNDIFDSTSTANGQISPKTFSGDTKDAKMANAEPAITDIFNQVNSVVTQILNDAEAKELQAESDLYSTHPIYKNIVIKLRTAVTTLPPSGAMVGVYARIDNNRGVWKAPANASLNSVVGVTETIDNTEQADLNVDPTAGKSINAIRPFTGRGILAWGARTLAGNDNEWRYISVRRLFNMVEESVKKSTSWAVFEPNDANTWLKVKSMIENYLVRLWRDGALAGPTPEAAFFVKVGLGSTMTQVDILEGRMNVEIGMAAVRPAEFIILKFSHKMQQA